MWMFDSYISITSTWSWWLAVTGRLRNECSNCRPQLLCGTILKSEQRRVVALSKGVSRIVVYNWYTGEERVAVPRAFIGTTRPRFPPTPKTREDRGTSASAYQTYNAECECSLRARAHTISKSRLPSRSTT